ncbi:hypothetical protein [uncultured Litoreibacter sp.]|uniref:hypothetical protein n=1 Tax=uncultured Litoreibacter sp. TaxID=1392394 RepID=UPI002632C35D|nr:hypothetical protein [uncultured Litoreibacter sp.]
MNFKDIVFAAATLSLLAACDTVDEEIASSTSAAPNFNPVVETKRLEDTFITIDGKKFEVRRNEVTYRDGRKGLGWAIVVEHRIVSCNTPNDAGCRAAYERQKRTIEDSSEGGMY